MAEYGFTKELAQPFETVVERAKDALQKEGFGPLCIIDVREKFKEKLDIDFRKYVILGVCNPGFAHEALKKDLDIGLLLPCNAVVYEKDGKITLSVIKPTVAMTVADQPALEPIAKEVEERLKRAFDAIQ